MKFESQSRLECQLMSLSRYNDERGSFDDMFDTHTFYNGTHTGFNPVKINKSFSKRGTIRGLHFQYAPFNQAKLVIVLDGKIRDVVLDIRYSSRTYGEFDVFDLDSKDLQMLYVPHGRAHGFSVLSDTATVLYLCDNSYSKTHSAGINVLDPRLGIDWGLKREEMIISEQDLQWPNFCNVSHQ